MEIFNSVALQVAGAAASILSILISIPAFCLLCLTLAAGKQPRFLGTVIRPKMPMSVAILVPAHNESTHILPTLQCLKAQLEPGHRIIVIADNCQDDTADVARASGVEVVERNDESLRGKGYALAFGIEALRNNPPNVVVVIDADCIVSSGGIQAVAQHCHLLRNPVQMLNLMVAPKPASLRSRLLEFAWLVKNHVRALGSFRLGQACHLMGTGMAIPWDLASTARLATGHIAEDMKLGLDMVIAGRPTQFLVEAQIISEFPQDSDVARAQKNRWEHGHIQVLLEELPRLVAAFIRRPSAATLVLAMDLAIPPLALYFLVLIISLPIFTVAQFLSNSFELALWISLGASVSLLISIALSWWRYARHLLGLSELITVPLYVAWKLQVYLAYFLSRKSAWIRTQRKV